MQVDHSYQPESPQPVVEKVLISEDNDAPGADSKVVQSKQDAMLLPECHQNSTVQISPSYGFGIMPPLQAAHPVPFIGHETQAPDVSQLSGFVVSLCSTCAVSFICHVLFALAIISDRLKFLKSI
jgi:hypothetical protein